MSCALEQDKISTMTPIDLLASYSGSSIKNNLLNEEPEPEKLKEEEEEELDIASLVVGVSESHCKDSSLEKLMFNSSNEEEEEEVDMNYDNSDKDKTEKKVDKRELEGEKVIIPFNLNLDSNAPKVDADMNVDTLTSLEKIKREEVDPSSCPSITSFSRAYRHQRQRNTDTDNLSLREYEKNYLFEVMPSCSTSATPSSLAAGESSSSSSSSSTTSSSSSSWEKKRKQQYEKESLSSFTKQQSFSNLDIKRKETHFGNDTHSEHSIRHLREAGLALRFYSEANRTSSSRSSSSTSCNSSPDEYSVNTRDFDQRNIKLGGDTNVIHVLAMLRRLTNQRNELKSLDNQLFELSAHYLTQLGTNMNNNLDRNSYSSSKIQNNPMKQKQSHHYPTKLELSSKNNYFSLDYQTNVNPLEMRQSNSYLEYHQSPFHEECLNFSSMEAIDLSQNSTKSAGSLKYTRHPMITEGERKRPQPDIPCTVNLKKSRLLAGNPPFEINNNNACASNVSNHILSTGGGTTQLTASSMKRINVNGNSPPSPSLPLNFASASSNLNSNSTGSYISLSLEPREKRFRSSDDIYYENGNKLPTTYYNTVITTSSSTNDLTTSLSHDDGNNNLNIIVPTTKADEDDIKMMNTISSLNQQEEQYLFVKEYINQYHRLNPLIPNSVSMLVNGSSTESITNKLAQISPINEQYYYNLVNSPTSLTTNNSDEQINCCTNYTPSSSATTTTTTTTIFPIDETPAAAAAAYVRATSELDRLPDLANCQHSALTTIESQKRHQTSTTHNSNCGQILTTINHQDTKDQQQSVTTNSSVAHTLVATQQHQYNQYNQLSEQHRQDQQHLSLQQQHQLRVAFRCQVCGSGFEDRHRLQQHLSIHLNLDPSWFEEKTIKETMAQYELKRGDYLCSSCNLRFETTAEFDKHMQLHGDKPHHCELCNQENKLVCFRYYRQLLTHLRSHCFLYSCRFVPDCKQTANRKDYLKLHILKHHLNNRLPDQYTICCH